ncbi:MAG: RNA polymerase factor sigma-54, partial [Gammaproteobacteria bacterium]
YVLHTLQRLEPIGTCALDLYDSLAIQLDNFYKDSDYYHEAMRIIKSLSKIDSSHDLKFDQEISSICKNEDFNEKAFELVKKLNPKPGLIISKKLDSYQILPEVVIYKRDDKWITELTSNKPPLKLNSEYVSIMKESKIKTDIDYLKKNYNEAKFIIKSIKNRNITILNVCKEIFKKQLDFLNNGDIGIKPMTLRDVSEALGIHESTVSRATSNKYVQTPRGVFEMKYFFTSELSTDSGQMVSSKAIMKMIKTFVNNEIKQKPLSDNQISELFKNKGISVARRTITKYREKLKIPSSNERKRAIDD